MRKALARGLYRLGDYSAWNEPGSWQKFLGDSWSATEMPDTLAKGGEFCQNLWNEQGPAYRPKQTDLNVDADYFDTEYYDRRPRKILTMPDRETKETYVPVGGTAGDETQ